MKYENVLVLRGMEGSADDTARKTSSSRIYLIRFLGSSANIHSSVQYWRIIILSHGFSSCKLFPTRSRNLRHFLGSIAAARMQKRLWKMQSTTFNWSALDILFIYLIKQLCLRSLGKSWLFCVLQTQLELKCSQTRYIFSPPETPAVWNHSAASWDWHSLT